MRTVGEQNIHWKRPVYEYTEELSTATLVGTGLYEDLLSSRPRVGGTAAAVPGNYKIKSIAIEPGRSSDGKITVTLHGPTDGVDNIPELDWGTESRPIEQHPKCPALKSTRPFYEYPDRAMHATNNKRYATAALAKNLPVAQRTFEHWTAFDEQDLQGGTWSLAQYKSLKEGGRNDYQVVFPIARKTTYSSSRPDTGSGNLLRHENPPTDTGAPGGSWYYFKSADRCSKESGGLWRRCEEWEGKDSISATLDGLLY